MLMVMAGIQFVHIMDFMIMMPLQEFLVPIFGVTPATFSYLVSAYGFAAFTASVTASFFADRFDRKRVLILGFAGFVVGTFACALAPSYAMLLVARIVSGLFGGMITAQILAIIGDTFAFEVRGQAMGVIMTGFALAAVLGVPLGLFAATHLGWHAPFWGAGLIGCGLLIATTKLVPPMRSHLISNKNHDPLGIHRSIMHNRQLQGGLLMMFLLILAQFSIVPFIAPYLEVNVGLSKNELALMYFVGGSASLLTSPLIGKWADRFGKKRVLLCFVALSTIPVLLVTHLPPLALPTVLFVTTLFFIIGGGRMVPAQALMTAIVPAQQRGGFMNINSSLQQLAVGLAAWLSGNIVAKNAAGYLEHYGSVGWLSVSFSTCALLLITRCIHVHETT